MTKSILDALWPIAKLEGLRDREDLERLEHLGRAASLKLAPFPTQFLPLSERYVGSAGGSARLSLQ